MRLGTKKGLYGMTHEAVGNSNKKQIYLRPRVGGAGKPTPPSAYSEITDYSGLF